MSKLSLSEFVAMIAALMGLTAFSIDNLLPAFGPIAESLNLANSNEAQLIILTFLASFAVMDLIYGPLSDHFGRKPALLAGLGLYLAGTMVGYLSPNFGALLAGRFLQGMGAASPRILAVAIVRDRYAGREMARILSLAMMVFFIVPVVAPSIGSFVLMFGSWRTIFLNMFLFGAVLTGWVFWRLPETRRPSHDVSVFVQTLAALKRICTNREAMGHATALSLMTGCLMTYIVSAPQIFETDIYHLGKAFPLVFGIIATFMGLASFASSALVRRFGVHLLSRIGLSGFLGIALLIIVEGLMFRGQPPIALFVASLVVAHFLFSLTAPNLNSMAMEPLGDVAGTASSFIGFYTTLVSAAIGFFFGKAFNGTIIPLGLCYAIMGGISLFLFYWVQRGQSSPNLE